MSHVRCIGVGVLFALLFAGLNAHGADGGQGPAPLSDLMGQGVNSWTAFWGAIGGTLGVVIGRVGGIPLVITTTLTTIKGKDL